VNRSGSSHKTLPPGELWVDRVDRSATFAAPASRACAHCGADPDALAGALAEREQILAELSAAHEEVARLRRASVSLPESAARSLPYAAPPSYTPAPSYAPSPAGGYVHAPFVPVTSAMAPGAVASADQGIDFGSVARLSPEELDKLPYGLITLDAEGRVIHYNDTESRLVGLPKERVIGKRFFVDVAPCARVREFEGRFLELARDPTRVRVQSFDFVFRFARGEHHVSIVMTPARLRGQFHLALVRRAIIA
jgi:photoactive yellow protein